MESKKIKAEALIEADKEKVWDYYTDPEHITRWNFASDDWECPHAENNLRPGGKYAARMQAKDGSFGFDFEAIYDHVDEAASLSYTMTDGRQAKTEFEDLGGITKVTTTFDAEALHDLDMQRAGWQAILDNFKKYAEEASSRQDTRKAN